MKKLALTICMAAMATGAFAQGTITWIGPSTALVNTNVPAQYPQFGGPATGPASNLPQSFYYALFTAAPGTVDNNPLHTATWTFTGNYATNFTSAGSNGRMNGGASQVANSWQTSTTEAFIIAGWSSNIGHDWNTVSAIFNGTAPNSLNYFYGVSGIGSGAAGGGPTSIPAFNLFGASPGQLSQGWTLGFVPAPEPSTFLLGGLGAAALVFFRRRK